jgi:hypothetical protein
VAAIAKAAQLIASASGHDRAANRFGNIARVASIVSVVSGIVQVAANAIVALGQSAASATSQAPGSYASTDSGGGVSPQEITGPSSQSSGVEKEATFDLAGSLDITIDVSKEEIQQILSSVQLNSATMLHLVNATGGPSLNNPVPSAGNTTGGGGGGPSTGGATVVVVNKVRGQPRVGTGIFCFELSF